MPPIVIESRAGGATHGNPFVGGFSHPAHIKVDISTLTAFEVDANGYLKPGLPVAADGTLVGAAERVFGVTVEPVKVAADNAAGTLAAVTNDPFVTVGTIGQVSQDIMEDTLGRALTADEIAGFNLAGSHLVLLPT